MPSTQAENDVSKRGFPWGIEICKLKHPRTGVMMPGLLPTDSGGILISYDKNRKADADGLAEYAVAQLLLSAPSRAIDIHVVDFSHQKRFPRLADLVTSKLYEIYHSPKEASNFLDTLEREIIRRHHDILGGDNKTISKFNELNIPEIYSAIIINLNDYPLSDASVEQIEKILKSAFAAGMYFLFLFNRVDNFGESDDQLRGNLLKIIKTDYPSLMLSESVNCERVSLSASNCDTHNLMSICEKFGLAVVPPCNGSDGISSLIDKLRGREQCDSDLGVDFLSVPIGTSPDGRTEITFNMGARSNCNHAFILGMNGTGKSTLLDHIIIQIAENYSSNEIRLYLMDYKLGVEFQKFRNHPNCEKILLDNSDKYSAEELLTEFYGLMQIRSEQFSLAKVKDITEFNGKNPDKKMYRAILIVDEARCLFDMSKNGDIEIQLTKIATQGRAFGIHMIFAAQTLHRSSPNTSTLLTQIKLRVAFRIDSTDCYKIFDDTRNRAAASLKDFQLIVNSNLGDLSSNVLCQLARPMELSRIDQAIVHRFSENPTLVLTPKVYERKPEARSQAESQQTVEESEKNDSQYANKPENGSQGESQQTEDAEKGNQNQREMDDKKQRHKGGGVASEAKEQEFNEKNSKFDANRIIDNIGGYPADGN